MANLRDLGLSEYEGRAYRALLRTGPTTAKELSEESDVPMGRIYDVLNSVEQYDLVRSQSASRPKKYVAVEPDTALNRLLADKKRDLRERSEQYERIVDELTGELHQAEPVEETFWTAAVGPEEVADLLVERIAAAESRVIVVAATFSKGFDIDEMGQRVAVELEAALERGVRVRLLMRPALVDELPGTVGERYQERLLPHEAFDCRTSPDVSGTFTIVDDIEVCIEVPHPLRAEETFAMIDFKDHEFVAGVHDEFEPRWADARPLRF